MSKKVGYNSALDGLRAFAVFEVVAYHARALGWVGGFLGVDLFFCLSGFLITSIILLEFADTGRLNLVRFAAHRFFRLYPALILMLATYLGYNAYLHRPIWRGLQEAGVGFSGIANWFRALGFFSSRDLGHLWSLSIEIQFYLLWAPLTLVFLKFKRSSWEYVGFCVALIMLVAWTRGWMIHHRESFQRLYNGTDTRFDSFVFGAILASVAQATAISTSRFGELFRRCAPVLFFLGLAIHVNALRHLGIADWRRSTNVITWVNFGSFCLVTGAYFHDYFPRFRAFGKDISFGLLGPKILTFSPIVFLGQISYGIYLWHYPVIHLVRFPRVGNDVRFLMIFSLTVVLATVSYYCVEKPSIRFARRINWKIKCKPSESDSGEASGTLAIADDYSAPKKVAGL